MLRHFEDPYLVAQHSTHGTMVFALQRADRKALGLTLLIIGLVVLIPGLVLSVPSLYKYYTSPRVLKYQELQDSRVYDEQT